MAVLGDTLVVQTLASASSLDNKPLHSRRSSGCSDSRGDSWPIAGTSEAKKGETYG